MFSHPMHEPSPDPSIKPYKLATRMCTMLWKILYMIVSIGDPWEGEIVLACCANGTTGR